jgi:hypothetical protein
MRKFILLCASLFTMVLLFSASPARAQAVVFVSSSGNDNNSCSQTSPCATFQRAVTAANGGQVNCLTSGNYGSFTITTSITVDCGAGNVGNIVTAVNSSASGITISTTAAATIVLRHLALNGLSTGHINGNTGANGIDASTFFSGTLIVEDCMIHGYSNGLGLNFAPISGRGLLQVSNSQVFDNSIGITVSPANRQIASVTLNTVEVVANLGDGLDFLGAGVIAGTMRNSVVGENGVSGVFADAGQVFFTIEESSIVDNLAYGILTDSAGTAIKVGASTIGGNGTGVLAGAGSIVSFGDNHMSDNASNGTFTSTKALQ